MRTRTVLGLCAFLLVLAFAHGYARADTNLVIACEKPGFKSGDLVVTCQGYERYVRAVRDVTLVRSVEPGEQPWGPNFKYETFASIPETRLVDQCLTNIPRNTKVPNPWSTSADKCKEWATILKKDTPHVLAVGPAPVKLTWNSVSKDVDGNPVSNVKYIIMGGLRGQPPTALWSGTALKVDILQPKTGDNCYNLYAETTLRSDPSGTLCTLVTLAPPSEGSVIKAPTNGSIVR